MADALRLDRTLLRPGMRLGVAVSGGADSVALLLSLVEAAPEIGLVLSVAHLNHGIRGREADADARFVAGLADRLGLALHQKTVDAPEAAGANHETLEEAARNLRYGWFRELLASGAADAVATAHTLDDQAETVLHKLLRGAWTEGLSGIHPVLREPEGLILRPFLTVRHEDAVRWLSARGQAWREDASNADIAYTRNRIRHELLPALEGWNPQIRRTLANLATLAREEEAYWREELARSLPQLVLPGRPVRGGGRSVATHGATETLAVELERLPHAPASRRRILRAMAARLGARLNFEQTDRLFAMCTEGGPRRQTLTAALRAERSARELRLTSSAPAEAVSAESRRVK